MHATGNSRTPNIVLINCDDLGYGDPGCYGSALNDTPGLNKMAAEGCRFTDFYMASPVCSASRAAMLTGCYPNRIGFGGKCCVLFPGQAEGLHRDEITMAAVLKSAGYATRIIGKWHCGDQPEFLPTRFGFDGYFGIPYSNDMGRQAVDDPRPPLPLLRDETVIQQQPDQTSITERYTEDAVQFIRANAERSFFLYLAHMHVHLPHYPPPHFLAASRNGPYGGAVRAIDWSTSVILDELRELGIDENTLVVFTSDNGSNLRYNGSNGCLRGHKGETWEGGMRVPCIMRWPGKIPAGSECRELVASLDLMPTFAALTGAAVPGDRTIDGYDQSGLLLKPEGPSARHTFFYYGGGRLEAVRRDAWKLFVARGRDGEAVQELYNLELDPGESRNCFDEEPDRVRELANCIAECRADIGDNNTQTAGANVRPIGRVDQPVPLTSYDPDHPYIIAMYDLPDRG